MRIAAILISAWILSACSVSQSIPPQPVHPPRSATPPRPTRNPVNPPSPPTQAAHALEPARATHLDASGITFEGVAFDARTHRLAVVDQAAGPGSAYPDAAAAGRATGAIAAINGGFFTPEGMPLGRLRSNGQSTGTWNTASSLGSGIWLSRDGGSAALLHQNRLSNESGIRHFLQSGPFLLENGQAVRGLDDHKSSLRSLIVWDGGTRWWIGQTSPCTLAQLARVLANAQPANWPPRHALNLDGGRSADLWIAAPPAASPVIRRTPWNRPVRNFLVLLRR